MTFIQKEKSVFVTTEEPLKTGIGFYGPHLIRLLHGSQKQTVYQGSQVTSHHQSPLANNKPIYCRQQEIVRL